MKIKVVCGILIWNDRILVGKRKQTNKHHPGKWEFPGGKVKINETPENAIIREVKEELNIDINDLPIAKKHSHLPWLGSRTFLANNEVPHELESRELGWSIEGESMVILPVSIFSRLFYSTLGTNSSLGPEILDSWEILGIEGKYVKPLIFASYSTYQLFINSDKHVFAESVESWISVISHYCGQWGWGDAIDLTVGLDSSSIKINCKQNEMLPFFIGYVMGIWERSNGRKPRVSLLFTEDDVEISIESLLKYI